MAEELARAGGDPATLARCVAAAVRVHGSLGRQLRRHEAQVRERRRQAVELARDVGWLQDRVKRLERVVERARREPGLKSALAMADDEAERAVLGDILRLAYSPKKSRMDRRWAVRTESS